MFFLLYKRTDNGVFDDFPKISDNFPKISEDFPKLSQRPDERSRTFSENFRRFPKTFEEDPKMFRWYTNEFKYNLRYKPDVTEIIDFFTCEDIVSFLSICYNSLYHWLLYNKYIFAVVVVVCSHHKRLKYLGRELIIIIIITIKNWIIGKCNSRVFTG